MSPLLVARPRVVGNVPAPPTGLSAANGSTPVLTWTLADEIATSVRVERREDGSGDPFTLIDTIGEVETYEDTGAAPDTTYEYRVRACNEDGCSGPSNTDTATTPSGPDAPSDLDTDVRSDSRIDLTWTVNETGSHTQRLQIREGGAGNPWTTLEAALADSENSEIVTGLDPDTLYSFRIRAENEDGNSAYSNIASDTTEEEPEEPPDAPSGMDADAVNQGIELSWTVNEGGSHTQRLQRRKDGDLSWTTLESSLSSSIDTYDDFSGLDPNTEYEYRVRAENADGNSGYDEASTTTWPDVPLNFSADESLANCPSGMEVALSWDNGGRTSQVTHDLQWHDGDGEWSDIPSTSTQSITHDDPTTAPGGHANHYRIRFFGFSEWAEDSAIVGECPS